MAWLTGRPPSEFILDQHLTVTAGPDAAAELLAALDINQAIGFLIGRGYTAQQADRQLDVQAANNGTDRHTAARDILTKITTADDAGHFGLP